MLFTLNALGGASLAAPADYARGVAVAGATSSCQASADSRRSTSQKVLTGKLVSARPYMSLSTHGISGSAAPAQLETALQLLHQRFIAPGDDPDAFALLKRQLDAIGRQSRTLAGAGVRRESVAGQHLEPLHRAAADRGADRDARSREDALVLPPAVLERRRFLVLHGRRVQGRRGRAAARAVRRIAAVDRRSATLDSTRTSACTSRRRRSRRRSNRGASRAARRSSASSPTRRPIRWSRRTINAATDRARHRAARHPARGSRPDLYACRSACRSRCRSAASGHIQVRFGAAPENIESMTARVMTGDQAAADRKDRRVDLTNRAKEDGAPELRGGAEAERLLAGAPAVRGHAGPRSGRDSDARRSGSTRSRRRCCRMCSRSTSRPSARRS